MIRKRIWHIPRNDIKKLISDNHLTPGLIASYLSIPLSRFYLMLSGFHTISSKEENAIFHFIKNKNKYRQYPEKRKLKSIIKNSSFTINSLCKQCGWNKSELMLELNGFKPIASYREGVILYEIRRANSK